MKVLATGLGGQLGFDVCRELERRGVDYRGTTSSELDITDWVSVQALLAAERPDAVIHCAAYTGVDTAEEQPERCWAVNVDGTKYLAQACLHQNAKLVYLSTDYVFPGTGERCYEVMDNVGPLNTYGRSKLAGELAVLSLMERYFIVRTSWVFGKNGSNFVKTMLRLSGSKKQLNVVCDQIGSPTYTADLAPLLCDMVQTERYGVYHATNEGFCSWAQFAEEIFKQSGKNVLVEPATTEAYGAKAHRPKNSRLSKASLEQNGFGRLPDWHSALERFLKEQ